MVRAPTSGPYPSLHDRAPARRNRAGRGARLPALSVELAPGAPGGRLEGPGPAGAVIGQLEGFQAPAAAWETELLPARVADYEPAWLDDQCLAGRVSWARLRPPGPRLAERAAAPVRATPIALLPRRQLGLWAALSPATDPAAAGPRARAVAEFIRQHGA